MDLEARLIDLHEALSDAGGNASWQTAQIFNALLEQTKQAHPDDPVVTVIEPAREAAARGRSNSTNASLKIAAGQLLIAVRGS
jgi:hypothetical protein